MKKIMFAEDCNEMEVANFLDYAWQFLAAAWNYDKDGT
jgi:hypothetical protein